MTLCEFKECYKMAKKIGMSLQAFLSIRRALSDSEMQAKERVSEGETHD